ncbi:hypothetical protein F5X99DRAFT_401458 [Biscogniauxia marginata]|nr:hypothetical protein F5X99DRAFT_401458 [Biscogniauxia marginata]
MRPLLALEYPDFEYIKLKSYCTNPLDILQGLRELIEPVFRDIIKPDYTVPVPKLFAKLTAYLLIFDGWADMFFYYPRRIWPEMCGGKDDRDIPTWAPNFTRLACLYEAEGLSVDKKQVKRMVGHDSIVIDKIRFMLVCLVSEIVQVYFLLV